jgi:hypothetical protein
LVAELVADDVRVAVGAHRGVHTDLGDGGERAVLVVAGILSPPLAARGQVSNCSISNCAEGLQLPRPIASLLPDRFLTLLANGGKHLDWSAISQIGARDARAR